MKTIPVSKQSKSLNALLEQARHESLILRAVDGTEFLLSAMDDADKEIVLARRNEKLNMFLEARARQAETIPLREVKRRLRLNDAEGPGGAKRSNKK